MRKPSIVDFERKKKNIFFKLKMSFLFRPDVQTQVILKDILSV